jgi:hypothetical protein
LFHIFFLRHSARNTKEIRREKPLEISASL